VTYTQSMLRFLVFAVPFIALAGLTVLLKQVDASAGVAFGSFGVLAVLTGSAIGYFVDRLVGPRKQSQVAIASRRAAPGAR
jgi:hypothetical protein